MAKKKSALLVVFAEKGLYNSFVPGEMGAKRKSQIGGTDMFTNFKELEAYVLSHKNKKRIVLANAHDEPALSAVVNAHRRGVVDGTTTLASMPSLAQANATPWP